MNMLDIFFRFLPRFTTTIMLLYVSLVSSHWVKLLGVDSKQKKLQWCFDCILVSPRPSVPHSKVICLSHAQQLPKLPASKITPSFKYMLPNFDYKSKANNVSMHSWMFLLKLGFISHKCRQKRLTLATLWRWAKGSTKVTSIGPIVLHTRSCSVSNRSKWYLKAPTPTWHQYSTRVHVSGS